MALSIKPVFNELAHPLAGGGGIAGELVPFLREGLLLPRDKLLQARGYDWRIYEDVRRDDQVKSTMQQRRGAVIAREWSVEAGGTSAIDTKAAEALQENLEQIPWDAICGKMHWGVFYGWSVGEIMWARDGNLIRFDTIKVRRRARFAWHTDGTLRLLTVDKHEGEVMPARKFWTFATGDDNDDDPYGLGLAHWLYWPVFFKKNDIKFWLVFLEKFGQPTALGKYPRSATPAEQDKLLEAAIAVAAEAAVTIPEGMALELLEAKRSGTSDYKAKHDTMNAAIAKVVLSQTMTTDDGSSRAQAEVHADVRDDVVKEDADLLCESFNTGPVAWWTEWNFPGAKPPRVWRRVEDEPDTKAVAERDAILHRMGYEPTEQYVKETYGEGFRRKKQADAGAGRTPDARPNGAGADETDDDSRPDAELADRAVCPVHGRRHTAAELAEAERKPDAIDKLVEAMMAEWEPAIAPLLEEVLKLADESASFEEFRRRIPELAARHDTQAFRDLFARGGLAVRLAADTGVDLDGDPPDRDA